MLTYCRVWPLTRRLRNRATPTLTQAIPKYADFREIETIAFIVERLVVYCFYYAINNQTIITIAIQHLLTMIKEVFCKLQNIRMAPRTRICQIKFKS